MFESPCIPCPTQNFGLSAVECAAVLEALESGAAAEFFHDPNKGGVGEGRVEKSLS